MMPSIRCGGPLLILIVCLSTRILFAADHPLRLPAVDSFRTPPAGSTSAANEREELIRSQLESAEQFLRSPSPRRSRFPNVAKPVSSPNPSKQALLRAEPHSPEKGTEANSKSKQNAESASERDFTIHPRIDTDRTVPHANSNDFSPTYHPANVLIHNGSEEQWIYDSKFDVPTQHPWVEWGRVWYGDGITPR
ncbi:MAG: hypothetical protein AAF802_26500, partial [Planctomycetota bacterium]